MAITAPAYDR